MTWSRLWRDPKGFFWQALTTRGIRLIVYLIVTAALFPSTRFIVPVVILVTVGVVWARDYRRVKSPKIFYLLALVAVLVVGYGATWLNVTRVDEQRIAWSPWGAGINRVEDGIYTGTGQGFRGPITLRVEVRNHRITDIQTLEYPDLISVQDNDLAKFKRQLLETGRLERPAGAGMFRGAQATLTGYVNAIEAALSKGIPNYPHYNFFSRAYLASFFGQAPTRVTLNAMAILFAAFLVFEYTVQSMLTPGTGRSINCYNCASCVGACPIKEAEGVQFPMGLVLLTRLGNYERVMELSKYCVGCGRCAAKCPIGNSGPLVISAAYYNWRKQKNEKDLLEEGGPA